MVGSDCTRVELSVAFHHTRFGCTCAVGLIRISCPCDRSATTNERQRVRALHSSVVSIGAARDMAALQTLMEGEDSKKVKDMRALKARSRLAANPRVSVGQLLQLGQSSWLIL